MQAKPETNNTHDSVVLVLSHLKNRGILEHYRKITGDCGSKFDVMFLGDNTQNVFSKFSHNKEFFLFSTSELKQLGYPGKSEIEYTEAYKHQRAHRYHKNRNFLMGNTELPLLLFFRNTQFPRPPAARACSALGSRSSYAVCSLACERVS